MPKPAENRNQVEGARMKPLLALMVAALGYAVASAGDLGPAKGGASNAPFAPPSLYPPPEKLVASLGNTTYFVDPAKGDDAKTGTAPGTAWRSIAKINALKLAPGDKVVIAPGVHEATLKPSGGGSKEKPAVIAFLPGVHEFAVEQAIRLPMFVSNSCDAPTKPKPIGILVQNVKHLRIEGGGVEGTGKTTILYAGRMVEFVNDHANDISYSGLVFDLKRPTVSEFRVMETAEASVIIEVAEGSTYEIKDGKFKWTGDLGPGWTMVQQAIPEEERCWRINQWDPFSSATAEDLGHRRVRLTYAKGVYGMIKGRQFQFRNTARDSVAGFNDRCKDITIRDCDFYALTNMGIVSQFTENITYQRVNVAPPKDTLRTCPAWADVFHFSGCRGNVLVDACRFSGVQDDPINVHGTHLRILEKIGENQLLLRFMQPQTYGFAAFQPGDEVAVISHADLRELPGNPRRRVAAIEPNKDDNSGKEWVLTLDGPAPAFGQNDVVDNLSWYPNLTARNCHVTMDSCRGFLITTRGKVLVEGNTFNRCAMAGILIEDDAEGWFESGPVRDMTIRNNRFINCGIEINPQTHSNKPEEPVHENIRIENNFFDGGGVSARSVKSLTVTGNRSPGGNVTVNAAPSCSELKIENNAAKAAE